MPFPHDFATGSKKALPIVLGYLPVGFAYGALAGLAGIELPYIVLMSLLVFAGSGQFVIVGMLAAKASAAAIIITVFFVNLRHLLMSASISPYLRNIPRKALLPIGFWLTDENYTLACSELVKSERGHHYLIGMFGTSYAGWVAGGLLGGLFGGVFSSSQAAATMEFALYGMFIFLLVIQMTEKKLILAAAVAGGLSLFFYLLMPGGSWHVILAAVIAATVGVFLERCKKQ